MEQTPHFPVLSIMQCSGSIVATFGTACANGMYMARRLSIPRLNSFGIFFWGHFSVHRPQPVQTSSLTYLALRFIVTSKLPTKPFTSVTSEYENMRILSFWATSTIFGVSMQAAQSSVGKVLSSCAILPPIVGFVSTMSTGNPASAISSAV